MTGEQAAVEIGKILDDAKLADVTNLAGARALTLIDQHTRRGEFLGGALRSKCYSTNPISAWKLPRVTYSNGSLKTGSNEFPKSDIQWSSDGVKNNPVYLKGYRGFRKIWGRQVGHVDMTFSGDMLRSLNYQVRGTMAVVTVSPDQMKKAVETNKLRQWLSLSDDELAEIKKVIERAL